MQLNIAEDYAAVLGVIARLNGFMRGSKPNILDLLRAIATGTHSVVPAAAGALEGFDWLIRLDGMICDRQPFTLVYKSSNKVEEFLVSYAEIIWREKRFYLEGWVEGLGNRAFRFDRILAVKPVDTAWREGGLDRITVRFKLFGDLALNYDRVPQDIAIESDSDGGIVVTRSIDSEFWFLRQISAYGADCEVLEPIDLRQKLVDRYRTILDRYCNTF